MVSQASPGPLCFALCSARSVTGFSVFVFCSLSPWSGHALMNSPDCASIVFDMYCVSCACCLVCLCAVVCRCHCCLLCLFVSCWLFFSGLVAVEALTKDRHAVDHNKTFIVCVVFCCFGVLCCYVGVVVVFVLSVGYVLPIFCWLLLFLL